MQKHLRWLRCGDAHALVPQRSSCVAARLRARLRARIALPIARRDNRGEDWPEQ